MQSILNTQDPGKLDECLLNTIATITNITFYVCNNNSPSDCVSKVCWSTSSLLLCKGIYVTVKCTKNNSLTEIIHEEIVLESLRALGKGHCPLFSVFFHCYLYTKN